MRAKITSVESRGVPDKERIIIKVLADTDIGGHVVFESRMGEDEITTDIDAVFWFPDKEVSAGDLVVLYTKPGTDNEKTTKAGSKSHFFYWGWNEAKWKTNKTVPVLVELSDWGAYELTENND